MLLIGVGGGMLFMPLILTATASVAPKDAGVTSGVISTSQQLGGALGLAILAILATSQTHHLQASRAPLDALNSGFHLAFLIGAALALTAAAIGQALLPARPPSAPARSR